MFISEFISITIYKEICKRYGEISSGYIWLKIYKHDMNTFICLVYLFIFNFGKYLSISVNTCLHPYICSYVCICKYLSMYVNMYISVHMICEYHQYMSMYVNMSISVHMCTFLNICLFMPTRKYLFICLYLWISLIHVNICQSVFICSYVCICKIFVYICQHANICSYVCIIQYC